jgi:hypothetical protein
LIDATFGIINYNDHYDVGMHQPMMVASKDIIKDDRVRNKLIDKCWLQTLWSPTINIKGGFFCEVAATFDMLFHGPGGYPIEPGWWKKSVSQFQDQRERYCDSCSIPIPMKNLPTNLPYDYVSETNAKKLEQVDSPLARRGKIRVTDEILLPEGVEGIIETNPSYNSKPFNYAVRGKHHWFRSASWKYYILIGFDHLKLMLRVN